MIYHLINILMSTTHILSKAEVKEKGQSQVTKYDHSAEWALL